MTSCRAPLVSVPALRQELFALRKTDVDLAAGIITVSRSHDRDTPKNGGADAVPIKSELLAHDLSTRSAPRLPTSCPRRRTGRCSGHTRNCLFFDRGVDLLCAQLARGHCSNRKLGVSPHRRGLAAWQVQRVTGYMRDQLGQDIGLRELAQLVRLSRFHFCTAFRLATGQTPHEWLVMRRIGRARELLADPSLRITDIALTVGYQTPSAFSASFRRLVRATPTEYRRGLKMNGGRRRAGHV